jgi:hypothetical protein
MSVPRLDECVTGSMIDRNERVMTMFRESLESVRESHRCLRGMAQDLFFREFLPRDGWIYAIRKGWMVTWRDTVHADFDGLAPSESRSIHGPS